MGNTWRPWRGTSGRQEGGGLGHRGGHAEAVRKGEALGDTGALSAHPDELMVTLIAKLLQHTRGLDQPLPSAPGLLQLHVQGGHKAAGVTLHPLQAAGLLLIHQVMELLELTPDHPAENIGLVLGQGGAGQSRSRG